VSLYPSWVLTWIVSPSQCHCGTSARQSDPPSLLPACIHSNLSSLRVEIQFQPASLSCAQYLNRRCRIVALECLRTCASHKVYGTCLKIEDGLSLCQILAFQPSTPFVLASPATRSNNSAGLHKSGMGYFDAQGRLRPALASGMRCCGFELGGRCTESESCWAYWRGYALEHTGRVWPAFVG
jgi:hypothetical protein